MVVSDGLNRIQEDLNELRLMDQGLSRPQVFRCDGEDAGCDPDQPHWLAVDKHGAVTSWRSWDRAMKRAVMGW